MVVCDLQTVTFVLALPKDGLQFSGLSSRGSPAPQAAACCSARVCTWQILLQKSAIGRAWEADEVSRSAVVTVRPDGSCGFDAEH